MMVYFRKRIPESVVNDFNEQIVSHGLNMIRSPSENYNDYSSQSGGISSALDSTKLYPIRADY